MPLYPRRTHEAFLILVTVLGWAANAEEEPRTRPLTSGEAVSASTTAEPSLAWAVELDADQYARVEVRQVETDAVVQLFGPDGEQLAEVDATASPETETVEWIAETPGYWTVRVSPFAADDSGIYEIELTRRPATDRDRLAWRATLLDQELTAHLEKGSPEGFEKVLEPALEAHREVHAEDLQAWAHYLLDVGLRLADAGALEAARPRLAEAVAVFEAGSERSDLATSLFHQADLEVRLGERELAEELYLRAAKLWEESLGSGSREVAVVWNKLATLAKSLGRYREAEVRYRRSLEAIEALEDRQPLDLPKALNNLGALYFDLAQYDEAEKLWRRSLALKEEVAPGDPSLATELNNLAELYRTQWRLAEAEPLYERALALREAETEPRLEKIATLVANLGLLRENQTRYADAEELLRRSLKIRLENPHRDPLGVALVLNNLAELLVMLYRFGEAESMAQNVLEIRREVLGDNHPSVADALETLGGLEMKRGSFRSAEPLYERVLTLREEAFGPQHPEVGRSLNDLATLYQELGRFQEAQRLLRRALEILEESFGSEHPLVAVAVDNLAVVLRGQGLYAEAEAHFLRGLGIRRRQAPEHPDLALSYNNLGAFSTTKGAMPTLGSPTGKRWRSPRRPSGPSIPGSLSVSRTSRCST